jgi:DNA helicase-2/ATP-dependent DNA helicase PcrA
VERPFALSLDGGVVTGRADIILDEEGGRRGTLAIVDYKVTTDEGREQRYREQLRVYSVAGRGEGLDVQAAYLHDLKHSTRTSVDIKDAATRETLVQISRVFEKLEHAEFVPKPDTARCQACEYKLICAHAPSGSLGT